MTDPDKFTCGACGGTFTKGWTDAEAAAEANAAFAPEDLADAAYVCDPCWRAMRRAMPHMDTLYGGGS